MKTIVVYSSETGFTGQYAQWISEELGCQKVELKNFNMGSCDADTIIYGGSLFAGKVRELDKFQKMNPGNYLVFAVGMTDDTGNYVEEVKKQNPLDGIKTFYFRGGARFKQLGFMSRTILKKVSKLSEDVDFTDRSSIKKLVDYMKNQ